MSRPCVSQETKELCKKNGINASNKKEIKGITPSDTYYCECRPAIDAMYKSVGEGKKPYYVECPKIADKKYKRYKIKCASCGELVADVYATDDTLTDYCDLHYLSRTDGDSWFGCLALNISPIDGKIGIECSCGQDTRDFRANSTLSNISDKLQNLKGREFGKQDSKFKTVKA